MGNISKIIAILMVAGCVSWTETASLEASTLIKKKKKKPKKNRAKKTKGKKKKSFKEKKKGFNRGSFKIETEGIGSGALTGGGAVRSEQKQGTSDIKTSENKEIPERKAMESVGQGKNLKSQTGTPESHIKDQKTGLLDVNKEEEEMKSATIGTSRGKLKNHVIGRQDHEFKEDDIESRRLTHRQDIKFVPGNDNKREEDEKDDNEKKGGNGEIQGGDKSNQSRKSIRQIKKQEKGLLGKNKEKERVEDALKSDTIITSGGLLKNTEIEEKGLDEKGGGNDLSSIIHSGNDISAQGKGVENKQKKVKEETNDKYVKNGTGSKKTVTNTINKDGEKGSLVEGGGDISQIQEQSIKSHERKQTSQSIVTKEEKLTKKNVLGEGKITAIGTSGIIKSKTEDDQSDNKEDGRGMVTSTHKTRKSSASEIGKEGDKNEIIEKMEGNKDTSQKEKKNETEEIDQADCRDRLRPMQEWVQELIQSGLVEEEGGRQYEVEWSTQEIVKERMIIINKNDNVLDKFNSSLCQLENLIEETKEKYKKTSKTINFNQSEASRLELLTKLREKAQILKMAYEKSFVGMDIEDIAFIFQIYFEKEVEKMNNSETTKNVEKKKEEARDILQEYREVEEVFIDDRQRLEEEESDTTEEEVEEERKKEQERLHNEIVRRNLEEKKIELVERSINWVREVGVTDYRSKCEAQRKEYERVIEMPEGMEILWGRGDREGEDKEKGVWMKVEEWGVLYKEILQKLRKSLKEKNGGNIYSKGTRVEALDWTNQVDLINFNKNLLEKIEERNDGDKLNWRQKDEPKKGMREDSSDYGSEWQDTIKSLNLTRLDNELKRLKEDAQIKTK